MQITPQIKEIVKGFFEAKVIQINTTNKFKLASGKESPIYLDHRKIFSYPSLRKLVIQEWSSLIRNEYRNFFEKEKNIVFAGTATAGIAPAYALAEIFSCGFIYVRAKAKEHGLKSIIEGFIPHSANIIVVDDMVTTGGSILQSADNLRHEGFKVLTTTSISYHNLNKTMSLFKEKEMGLLSLFKTTDILDVAYGMNFVDSKEMRSIMEWITSLDS
ncbi:MAG: phosphoribosyltransferase family protein [Bdellovibrionota bacterium]